MGLYAIDCPSCSKPHVWFSGNVDQRCEACRKPREWEIQTAPTTILPPDLRIAQIRFPGQVDASPHWIPVIEKSAYDLQEQQIKILSELLSVANQRVLIESAEVSRLLALLKRRNKK